MFEKLASKQKEEAVREGQDMIVSFTAEERNTLRLFMQRGGLFSSVLNSQSNDEESTAIEKLAEVMMLRNEYALEGKKLSEGDIVKIQTLAHKIGKVTRSLPEETICRLLHVNPGHDITESILETGGVNPLYSEMPSSKKPVIDAHNTYVDSIFRGERYLQAQNENIYILVYDDRKLRPVPSDLKDEYRYGVYAKIPIEGETFQGALVKVLYFPKVDAVASN